MRDAASRRRNRDLAALALGLAGVMNRIPFNTRSIKPDELAQGMAAADIPDEEDLRGEG